MGKIATISGRYYGMDRDNNFDRLKKAYDAIVYGEAKEYSDYEELINDNYNQGIFDEFVIPGIITKCPLSDNDGFITFNFTHKILHIFIWAISNNLFNDFATYAIKCF